MQGLTVEVGNGALGAPFSVRRQGSGMHGAVIWYHPDLRCALIERAGGLTLGTVEEGRLDLFHDVWGDLASTGPKTLSNVSTGRDLAFNVEAVALSEDQANELLGLLQG